MARDYGNYDDGGSSENNSDNNDGGYDDGEEDKNLILTPYAEIEGDLEKVFGNDNSFGQSLGISWENVELVDGCLYYDSEKNKYKVFAWKDVVGMNPGQGDFSADDANQFLVKNYGGTEKRYELEVAVHPDQDEPVAIGGAIMWYGGSDEYGPKSASKTLAQILTQPGREMVVRDADGNVSGDNKNWLTETSAADVTRSDLKGRRFAFFEIKKDSNSSDRKFHHPIVEDTATGTQVTANNNSDEGETQGTLEGDSEAETAAATDGGAPAAQTEAGVPEPITDFVSSVGQFDDFTRERAANLLEDFIGDDGLPLTQDLVDEFGGEEAVLSEAGY
jgi:hypothetical protein